MRQTTNPSARHRFVATTETMLREAGVHGTGIKDVVARSGAPIGSLYHYFPRGKSQLVGEALAIHAMRVPRLVARFFDDKPTAAAALHALFDTAAAQFDRSGANKGCAVGAVALDLTPADAELQAACRQAFDDWVAAIAPRLPFADAASRRSFAVMIVLALEGAFVLSRAAHDGQPFREAGRWLSSMLSAPNRRRGATRQRKSTAAR